MENHLNKLIVGTANFNTAYGIKNNFKRLSNNEKKLIINYLKFKKKLVFDTAQAYRNEKFIGKIKFQKKIYTKIKFKKNTNLSVSKSFADLKTKNIHGIMFHNVKDIIGRKGRERFNVLKRLKKLKMIKQIGISIYNPGEIKYFYKKFKIDFVQIPLNIFDQRLINSVWFKKLKREKIEIHARSIFLQGLLLLKKKDLPKKFLIFKAIFEKWYKWNKTNNLDQLESCLEFIHKQKVNKIVVGVDNLEQLKKIVNYKNSKKKYNFGRLKTRKLKLISPNLW